MESLQRTNIGEWVPTKLLRQFRPIIRHGDTRTQNLESHSQWQGMVVMLTERPATIYSAPLTLIMSAMFSCLEAFKLGQSRVWNKKLSMSSYPIGNVFSLLAWQE